MHQLTDKTLPEEIRRYLRFPHMVFIVDTSGSILVDWLPWIRDEMQQLLGDLSCPGLFLYVDDRVRDYQFVKPGQRIDLTLVGGFGTDFRPGFAFIVAEGIVPHGVVYFTDGKGADFPPKPPYRVDWVQIGLAPFHPPFGRVLRLKRQ
jgi:predicted metal-dependent peptidase